jgi:hypothetical protein
VCGWNLGGVEWLLRIPARSTGGLRWRKEEEEETGEGRWGSGRLYRGKHGSADGKERERERGGRSQAELKTAGGAGVPSGVWQPPGSGGATWQGEGRTAEAAQAVGGGWGDASTGGAALQKLRKRPAAAVTRARRGTEEIRDPRKTMEDLNANLEKGRDPSVKHR